MARRRRAVAIAPPLAAAALLAGGCGDGASDPASSPAATPAAKPEARAKEESARATIRDFAFMPKSVTVPAGGSVTWTDEDSANHNVAFDDKNVEGIDNLRKGQSGTVTFTKAGTYAYVCTYHPGMEGTVIVK